MTEVNNVIGAALTVTTAGTSTDGEDAEFKLGTCLNGSDNTVWCYVQANGAIDQYDAVGIDENFQAAALTKTMVDDGWNIAFAQVAFSDNDFGWVALRGANIQVNVLASCAVDVALYSSGSAGHLDDDSSSQTKVEGVVLVAAASAQGNYEVLATYPRSTTF